MRCSVGVVPPTATYTRGPVSSFAGLGIVLPSAERIYLFGSTAISYLNRVIFKDTEETVEFPGTSTLLSTLNVSVMSLCTLATRIS